MLLHRMLPIALILAAVALPGPCRGGEAKGAQSPDPGSPEGEDFAKLYGLEDLIANLGDDSQHRPDDDQKPAASGKDDASAGIAIVRRLFSPPWSRMS